MAGQAGTRRTLFLTAGFPPLRWIAARPWYPWAIVGITCIGAFIGQVDASIVQLALPRLAHDFRIDLETVSWVSLAYLLAFAACLPVFGHLCEVYGRKPLYLIGYAVFTAASALCGFAPSIGWLIVFRALQGIGGSMLGANSIAILVATVSGDQRSRAMGYFAAVQAVGVSLGPALGGLLLHFFGWRSVFWATVPFGVGGAILGGIVLPLSQPADQRRRFDLRGTLMLMPALILFVLALNETALWGIASLRFLGAVAIGVLLLFLFARQELRAADPLVRPDLLGDRRFAFGAAAVLLGYALLYAMFFVMSFALIRGYHEDEIVAGFRLALVPVFIGLVAPFSGALVARRGSCFVTVLAMILCAISILFLAVFAREGMMAGPAGLAMLSLFGVSLGLFIAPSNHAAIGVAPPAASGEAGSLLNLMRVLGTSIGVASASGTLSWGVSAATRAPHGAFLFTGNPVLSATEANFAFLLLFVLLALMASVARDAGLGGPSGKAPA